MPLTSETDDSETPSGYTNSFRIRRKRLPKGENILHNVP